jgi:small subunit ribosomal protein S1
VSNQENFDFASLLDEFMDTATSFEGKVVKGTVVSIEKDVVLIDVGLKSEGNVSLRELQDFISGAVSVGQVIDIYVEKLEDRNGEVVLSIEKSRREACWSELEKAFNENSNVVGVIHSRVKGGYAVKIEGVPAFLPGSQVDIRPVRDANLLIGMEQPFKVLKIDRPRNNIVVSRRAVLEEARAEAKGKLISELSEGQIINGMVKSVTDYGAFIDLGGVDGLLHVTDISWKRVHHPSDLLKPGQNIDVMVLRFNKDIGRISLGMKQLEPDPWAGIDQRYKVGTKIKGKVSSIVDYGVFVTLEDTIEGLIHTSEMSWTKKNIHPSKLLCIADEVEAMILEVDGSKKKLSLGLKQCLPNPWKEVIEKHPVGSVFSGPIKNITEFGIFVGVTDELDGMVHMNDVSWQKAPDEAIKDYAVGQSVEVMVRGIDPDNERIRLGIKQLQEDKVGTSISQLERDRIVPAKIMRVSDRGLDVMIHDEIPSFIKRADLAKERSDQRIERFNVGDVIEAKVVRVDKAGRKVELSIRAIEIDEHKKMMSEYGSSDQVSGTGSLGDILGEAMKNKN